MNNIFERIKEKEEQIKRLSNNTSLLAMQILINSNELTRKMANGNLYFFTDNDTNKMCYSTKKYPTGDNDITYIDEDDQKFLESMMFIIEYLNKKNSS